jgi:hypothetical protein
MPDSAFRTWQAVSQELREVELRLLLASDPSSSAHAGADVQELQERLAALRIASDNALRLCLSETSRVKRVTGSVGLASTLDSVKPRP